MDTLTSPAALHIVKPECWPFACHHICFVEPKLTRVDGVLLSYHLIFASLVSKLHTNTVEELN